MTAHTGDAAAVRVTLALKEWDVVVAALEQGRQAILIRKGGLDDPDQRLPVPEGRFWLYPTLFHERGVFLRPEHRALLVPGAHRLPRSEATTLGRPEGHGRPVAAGCVALRAVGEVVHSELAPDLASLSRLLPLTVWTQKYPTLRYRWRPEEKPLVLVLRVSVLAQPVEIAERSEYGGCRSLVDLVDPPDAATATPVWTEERLESEVEAVRAALSGR
ncbi:MAG TPA: DUF1802 family protein [Candidatus Dormibacteraeota bacterium]|nr:DUF1802 family protein [Candidatus Dormibacteraeota bacterium]